MRKEELITKILEHSSNDEDFLMNDCNGLDLMTDAVAKHIKKKKKEELLKIYEEAKKSKYFQEEDKQ